MQQRKGKREKPRETIISSTECQQLQHGLAQVLSDLIYKLLSSLGMALTVCIWHNVFFDLYLQLLVGEYLCTYIHIHTFLYVHIHKVVVSVDF